MKWQFYSREKFRCPECGEYRFVRMVDENGTFYPENVGRCDRENNCGYMYHASQWLKDNPDGRQMQITEKVEQPKKQIIDGYYSFSHELWDVIKDRDIRTSAKIESIFNYKSEFTSFLINELYFSNEQIKTMLEEYKMVTLTHVHGAGYSFDPYIFASSVKFFYVSASNEIRAVEQISYNGFKRSKKIDNQILNKKYCNFGVNRKHYNADTTEINWCLFGEHLISKYPNKPIFVVEGVKTAFGMALYYPEYNWIATGSSNRLIHLNFNTNHLVHFIPDAGFSRDKSYAQIWKEKIKKMYGVSFKYDIYEFNDDCSSEEIANGFDILDMQFKEPERAKKVINTLV